MRLQLLLTCGKGGRGGKKFEPSKTIQNNNRIPFINLSYNCTGTRTGHILHRRLCSCSNGIYIHFLLKPRWLNELGIRIT